MRTQCPADYKEHKKVLLRISQILQQLTKNYFNLEVLIWTITVAATETLLVPWMAHLLIHEKLLSTDYDMRGKKGRKKNTLWTFDGFHINEKHNLAASAVHFSTCLHGHNSHIQPRTQTETPTSSTYRSTERQTKQSSTF
jgi:hypothetical protein